ERGPRILRARARGPARRPRRGAPQASMRAAPPRRHDASAVGRAAVGARLIWPGGAAGLKRPARPAERGAVARRAPLPALAVLIGRLVARAAAWLGPVALRAARASVPATARLGRATLRGLASMRRAAVRRRDLLVALGCRAAWWGS